MNWRIKIILMIILLILGAITIFAVFPNKWTALPLIGLVAYGYYKLISNVTSYLTDCKGSVKLRHVEMCPRCRSFDTEIVKNSSGQEILHCKECEKTFIKNIELNEKSD